MKIDQEVLEDYGLLLLKLKMFPYFDIAHYILMCLVVRDDIHLHQSGKSTKRKSSIESYSKLNNLINISI